MVSQICKWGFDIHKWGFTNL
uniref:Uncharacterized protein n=1 Tax=Anguilla anguilla TaxID=7936 RepID=A0A0E9V0B6_ANGAN